MKKKILSVILALGLALSLTACGNSENSMDNSVTDVSVSAESSVPAADTASAENGADAAPEVTSAAEESIPLPEMPDIPEAPAEDFDCSWVGHITYGEIMYIDRYKGSAEEVRIPSVLEGTRVGYIEHNSFEGCDFLKTVIIPDGVNGIWSHAFSGCTSLETVFMPDSVVEISDTAFEDCENLKAVVFLGKVYDYDHITDLYYAVSGNTLPEVQLTPEEEYDYVIADNAATIIKYNGKGGDIVIPSELEGVKVTAIGSNAFSMVYDVTSLTIPDSVTKIESYAFSDFNMDAPLVLPDSIEEIGDFAFSETTITSVKLGSGIRSIGEYAFARSYNLRSVTITKNIENVGSSAFAQCESLSDVALPDDMTEIARGMFCYDRNLTSINIPSGVTSIGNAAFYDTGLTSVSIPEGVTYIGEEAFRCCSDLSAVNIPAGLPELDGWNFGDCPSLKNVAIPDSVSVRSLECVFNGSENINVTYKGKTYTYDTLWEYDH